MSAEAMLRQIREGRVRAMSAEADGEPRWFVRDCWEHHAEVCDRHGCAEGARICRGRAEALA